MASSRRRITATSAKSSAGELHAHIPLLQRLDRHTDACVITREVANAAPAWSYQPDRS